jgi:hypothetical protein
MLIGVLLVPVLAGYGIAVIRIVCRFNDEHALAGRFGDAEQERRIARHAQIAVHQLERHLQRQHSRRPA